MLELRPTCENCNKPLPPNARDARICTTVRHRPVDPRAHATFAAPIAKLAPHER